MIFLYLISAVVTIIFVKFYLHKRRIMKYVGHLPAPPEVPIIGSGLYLMGKNTTEIMDIICLATEMYETPSRFWLGSFLTILLARPDDFQTVLLSSYCLEKSYVYRFFTVNLGLFSSPVHSWKPQRKLLNPTFNNKILLSFIPIFNEKSRVLVDILGKKVGEKEFDIYKNFMCCSLEMISATTIGYNFDFEDSKIEEMVEVLEAQNALIANRMSKFWLHPDWIYKWTTDYKTFMRDSPIIWDIPRTIRQRKLQEFDAKCSEHHEELKEDECYSTPQIFIDELLKLHSKGLMDLPTLDDQIITMLIGGNETSALVMSHLVLLLAMHPEAQEKAFQEIKDVHQSQTSPSDFETISKLDYLEMCFKEAMRLFPVGPFLSRENTEDIKLSNCTVPKGTTLILSAYNLHRNRKVWGPNADMFDPDNFLPEKVATRHPYSYVPFSGGPRNCIGMKYAWLSIKIILSAIMRQYKFSTRLKLEDIVLSFQATLRIDNRHMVSVEKREKY